MVVWAINEETGRLCGHLLNISGQGFNIKALDHQVENRLIL